MRMTTKTLYYSLILLLSAACSTPETDMNSGTTDFQPSKLASIQISQDYEINFWEVAPGDIVVDRYRSIDAEKKAPSVLKELMKEKDYVVMYKKLAGPKVDAAAIKKLEQAKFRSGNVLLKQWKNINEDGLFLETSQEINSETPALRVAAPIVQARCSPDFNANSPDPELRNFQALWFYNNFVIDEETGVQVAYDYRLLTPSMSVPISTVGGMRFDICIENSQYPEQAYPLNVLSARVSSVFNATINPQKVRTFTVPSNRSGTFSIRLSSPEDCATTHWAVYWVNL